MLKWLANGNTPQTRSGCDEQAIPITCHKKKDINAIVEASAVTYERRLWKDPQNFEEQHPSSKSTSTKVAPVPSRKEMMLLRENNKENFFVRTRGGVADEPNGIFPLNDIDQLERSRGGSIQTNARFLHVYGGSGVLGKGSTTNSISTQKLDSTNVCSRDKSRKFGFHRNLAPADLTTTESDSCISETSQTDDSAENIVPLSSSESPIHDDTSNAPTTTAQTDDKIPKHISASKTSSAHPLEDVFLQQQDHHRRPRPHMVKIRKNSKYVSSIEIGSSNDGPRRMMKTTDGEKNNVDNILLKRKDSLVTDHLLRMTCSSSTCCSGDEGDDSVENSSNKFSTSSRNICSDGTEESSPYILPEGYTIMELGKKHSSITTNIYAGGNQNLATCGGQNGRAIDAEKVIEQLSKAVIASRHHITPISSMNRPRRELRRFRQPGNRVRPSEPSTNPRMSGPTHVMTNSKQFVDNKKSGVINHGFALDHPNQIHQTKNFKDKNRDVDDIQKRSSFNSTYSDISSSLNTSSTTSGVSASFSFSSSSSIEEKRTIAGVLWRESGWKSNHRMLVRGGELNMNKDVHNRYERENSQTHLGNINEMGAIYNCGYPVPNYKNTTTCGIEAKSEKIRKEVPSVFLNEKKFKTFITSQENVKPVVHDSHDGVVANNIFARSDIHGKMGELKMNRYSTTINTEMQRSDASNDKFNDQLNQKQTENAEDEIIRNETEQRADHQQTRKSSSVCEHCSKKMGNSQHYQSYYLNCVKKYKNNQKNGKTIGDYEESTNFNVTSRSYLKFLNSFSCKISVLILFFISLAVFGAIIVVNFKRIKALMDDIT